MKILNVIAPLLRFTDLSIEDEDERMRVLTRTALCCGGSTHIVLLFVFYLLEVPEMIYFNILSVVWWLGALIWHIKSRRWFWPLSCIWVEMLIHAVLATWYVGWGTGYWIYCVIMIAAMSLLPRARWLSMVTYLFTVALFGAWYLIGAAFEPVYVLDPGIVRLKFVVNGAAGIGFMVLTINLAATLQRRAWQEVEQLRVTAESERKRIEAALRDLKATQAQLIQQEKLASLGKLTAGIAHEIKNPLNFITNFSQLNKELAEELREAMEMNQAVEGIIEDLEQNATRIHRHGERANNIVMSMMQHASNGHGEREQADVNTLVLQNIDLAYHGNRVQLPGFEVTIKQQLDNNLGEIEINPQEIGRVLLNLLGNAFDAVYDRASNDDAYTPVVTVTTRRLEDELEVVVSDNGMGMSDEVREKVFEPFFTTKPTGSGTGLGLSLSHDIVTQGHGGTLMVNSEPGKGSAFTMRLPVSTLAVVA